MLLLVVGVFCLASQIRVTGCWAPHAESCLVNGIVRTAGAWLGAPLSLPRLELSPPPKRSEYKARMDDVQLEDALELVYVALNNEYPGQCIYAYLINKTFTNTALYNLHRG